LEPYLLGDYDKSPKSWEKPINKNGHFGGQNRRLLRKKASKQANPPPQLARETKE